MDGNFPLVVRIFAKSLLFALIAVAIYFGIKFFWPVSYDVKTLQGRPTTRYWDLSTGSRIAYTHLAAQGKTKHPYPVVYLHGGPGAGITDREIQTFSQLADSGFTVYLYDQVGCGYSNRLKDINDYTIDRHKADLREIVRHTGTGKVNIAAQSWGSILAVAFLAEHPSLVNKLIITAPAPIQPARKELELIRPRDSLDLRPPAIDNNKISEKVSNLRSMIIHKAAIQYGLKLASDEEADRFATYYATELNKVMVCDSVNAVIAEGTEGFYAHYVTPRSLRKITDVRPFIQTLETPVLIMKAQCDNQPWGYTTEYLSIFRNHLFAYIPNAGHNIFLEQPAVFVKTIDEFLRQ